MGQQLTLSIQKRWLFSAMLLTVAQHGFFFPSFSFLKKKLACANFI